MKTDSQFVQSKKQVTKIKKNGFVDGQYIAISKQSKAAYLKLNSESEIKITFDNSMISIAG